MSPRFLRSLRHLPVGGLVLLAVAGLAASACGDDDDDSATATSTRPRSTATEGAASPAQGSSSPTAAATSGGGSSSDYVTKVKAAGKKLGDDAEDLVGEMIAAQLDQDDAKTAEKLNTGADAVLKDVEELKAIVAPVDRAKVSADLHAAADQLRDGANQLKDSVKNDDESKGADAFTNLTVGRNKLETALDAIK